MRKVIFGLALVLLLAGCSPQKTAQKVSSTVSASSRRLSQMTHQTKAKASSTPAKKRPALPFAKAKPISGVRYISNLFGQDIGTGVNGAGYYLRLNQDGSFWLRVNGTFKKPKNTGNVLDESKNGMKTDMLYVGTYQQLMPGTMQLNLTGQLAFLFKEYTKGKIKVDSRFATANYTQLFQAASNREIVTWPLASAQERLGFPLTMTRKNGAVSLNLLSGNHRVSYPLALSDGKSAALSPQQFAIQYLGR